MTILILLAIAAGMILAERFWPARGLPRTENWWARVVLVNVLQAGIVILAGVSWDGWLQRIALINLSEHLPLPLAALVGYIAITFVYYFWHRFRHESALFWKLCHQLHHSPRRLEIVTSFYKHPVEITLNSILSGLVTYVLLGLDPAAAGATTFLCGVAEFFYHWNVRTPRWLGWLIQRPESHRIHHRRGRHTHNYGDLPLWDFLFGTLDNARADKHRCGFDPELEDRLEDMLLFRDVHAPEVRSKEPTSLLPTCIGCSKRWACQQSKKNVALSA